MFGNESELQYTMFMLLLLSSLRNSHKDQAMSAATCSQLGASLAFFDSMVMISAMEYGVPKP